jgi:hypothetical protein
MVVTSQNQFFCAKIRKNGLIVFYHISNTTLSFRKVEIRVIFSQRNESKKRGIFNFGNSHPHPQERSEDF